MSGPVLQMLGATCVALYCPPASLTVSTQRRSNRYNVEPFFFSSSINWIPSRYQACILCAPLYQPHLISRLSRKILSPKWETVRGNWSIIDNLTPSNRIDITVTLTFMRTMDQSKPLNPSMQSTLVQRSGFFSRLKSVLSVFSWWNYFSDQMEGIANIDTLAPLFLHSSTIDDQIL